ncbi:rRNA maturation RNase YbeY [Clostridium folliculivorans]|uniref:Endoribonuclease YbeY n=1 Tax=Clostridium folliculivorans TaxID=2886038 RepID=A0A9W5XYX6_9CLOT|nr:rRNA maturation RNase YbeY [Clostridium folliculivorans]GKU23634.1 endoribonuclease YbeY [Clostridium folliculivorans]GKU29750.1 endoribonuclease YbeY [Clostridium folliculivorans]
MIFIDDRQDKMSVDSDFEKTIEEVILTALKEELVDKACEISVIFVDNDSIKEINKETRDIDRETDVLSFPMLDYPKGKVYKDVYLNYNFDASFFNEGDLVLGDVVLSLEKAKEQSEDFNHSFTRECCYLVVHSILHLLGYDHMEEDEKKIMREREESILGKLNITREV